MTAARSMHTAYGPVEVQACTARIFRVRLFGPPEVPDASYVGQREWPPLGAGSGPAGEEDGTVAVATAAGAVRATADPLTLAFLDADGRALVPPAAGGSAGRERVHDPVSGQEGWRLRLTLPRPAVEETHCYGLGQGGGGAQLERLGTSRMLWNSHHGHGPGTDMAVPLLVCIGRQRAFGLFFDTTAAARLDVQRSDRGSALAYEADTGTVDLYFLAGPTPADVLGAYAELTGHPPLPPRWALGYIQSTRHWDDTDEIRATARTLREKGIPCDAVVFLSTYGEAKSWNIGVGHLDFEPQLFSDPPGLMRELQEELGYRVVTHEYPVLHPEARQFDEAERRGFLLAPTPQLRPGPSRSLRELDSARGVRTRPPASAPGSLTPEPPPNPSGRRPRQNYNEGQRTIDFSSAEARAWWWEQHRELVSLGVAGWWLDGAEGPPAQAQLAGGPGRLLHNAYALLRMRAFAEGEARDRPQQRPWMLCRSGGPGMQRYGAATWSGDINTTFATFEAQVPLGLNTSLSGVPYWGTDIGGFFPTALPQEDQGPGGSADGTVSPTGELYARWFQFGALCPVFRSHGWVWRQHVPWAHGEEVEAICRRYAELRLQLLPYLYTLAWEAHTRGEPLMRPLVYHFPADPNAWELGSQYLLGPHLLVAPVTRAGATHWPVYLPPGEWYDFWSHERHRGGRGISVPTPLGTLPVLVRGGAIVPIAPVAQRTDDQPRDRLTLLCYPPPPGQTTQATLYEDDGHTRAYERGERALTTVRCQSLPDGVRLELDPPQGRYRDQPPRRDITFSVWLAAPPAQAEVSRAGAAPETVAPGTGTPDAAPGQGGGPWAEAPWWSVTCRGVALEEGVVVTFRRSTVRPSS